MTEGKILFLVSKIVGTLPKSYLFDVKVEQQVEYIVNRLCTQHREYQRKNQNSVKQTVKSALERIRQQQEQQKRGRKKRARTNDDDSSDDNSDSSYERQAQQHDLQQQQQQQQVSSMSLNASLQARYKQVSKQRDNLQQQQESQTLQTTTTQQQQENNTNSSHNTGSKTSNTKRRNKKKKQNNNVKKRNDDDLLFLDDDTNIPIFSPTPRPAERYSDLGGIHDIFHQIRQWIEYPILRPEVYRHFGLKDVPRGILLRGPPGCGKTHLANAIAGQLNLTYFRKSATELVSSKSGESELRIRRLFEAARNQAPALLFLDEIDAIAPKRNNNNGMERRMVAQLLTCMDSIAPQYNANGNAVIVLAATNRPDSLDPALRRAGRFDYELVLGVPNREARRAMLETMTRQLKLSPSIQVDFDILARQTPGFVGADLRSLVKETVVVAMNRIFNNQSLWLPETTDNNDKNSTANNEETSSTDKNDSNNDENDQEESKNNNNIAIPPEVGTLPPLTPQQLEPLFITMNDFLDAIPNVQPSSKREGFATVPNVSWKDIGALDRVRQELTLSVLEPIRHPEQFKALGLTLPMGVLLYGPPGCGKTLLAKAIANESGANFLSVKGPELLDKYVGESERAVRRVFERARASRPCVVFFDELDSLCPKRGGGGGGESGVSERVVNQLLTEMDGLTNRRGVFVLAATNRPELIDPAMMRPGRLDKLLYVPLPTAQDRVSILRALSSQITLDEHVDLNEIGTSSQAEGYSGADCAALLREAGLAVLKERMTTNPNAKLCIARRHFDLAFHQVLPSVSKRDEAKYVRMRDRMARARSRGGVADVVASTTTTNEQEQPIDAAPDVEK